MNKNLVVNCPKCKESFAYGDSQFRPFCSERCKEVDLGHWFQENYKVPSKEKLSEEDIEFVIKESSRDSHGEE